MASLVKNKSTLLTDAVYAKLDFLLREESDIPDVVASPIAGKTGFGDLPWWGWGFMTELPGRYAAQIRVTGFGGFSVILGTPDNLRFPFGPTGTAATYEDFADPMDAAKVILTWLKKGKVTKYRRRKR